MFASEFDFESVLSAGDRISFGQACSEPVGLLRALLTQRERLHSKIGRLSLFVAGSYSGLLKPEYGDCIDFYGYGAIGDAAELVRKAQMEIFPVHYSQLTELLTHRLQTDVVLLQVSKPDSNGRYSLGIASDYQLATARRARIVIAEINAKVPFSPHSLLPTDILIHQFVESFDSLIEGPQASIDSVAEKIASNVASLVKNGATIQMGIGSLMDAICLKLGQHKELGIHSGILTDGMAKLMQIGVVTNAFKPKHRGLTVVGSLLGSSKLFEFAHMNKDICLSETNVTHGWDSLSGLSKFCAINSAVEVDLTGQVNGEIAAGRYVGAVGGQVDFLRAAARIEGGMSIVALPSTAGKSNLSRIVSQLTGPVTSPRSDVDHVVTEWGVAKLRGLSLRQRALSMASISHPDHRDQLFADAQKF